MSFFYPIYNAFGMYPETYYQVYTEVPLNTVFQPFVLTNFLEKPEENNLTRNIETLQSLPNIEEANMLENDQLTSKKVLTCMKKPITKKKKDQNFGWRNQNKDRNQISNILKNYVNFILQGKGMIKLMEQILRALKPDSAVSQFYAFLQEHFSRQKTYIGSKYMSIMLKNSSLDSSMLFLLRKTLKIFLTEIYPLTIVQGQRLKKKCKLTLLNKARQITKGIFIQ